MKKRNEIITIVDKTEYQKLMAYINHEDPKGFCDGLQCIGYALSAKTVLKKYYGRKAVGMLK